MLPPAIPPFLADILSQPASLLQLDRNSLSRTVAELAFRVDRFDRIVLTGMGASLEALRPSWMDMVSGGRPAWLIDTAELIGSAAPLVTASTLIVAASQSGRSVELVDLAETLRPKAGALLAITNDAASPLAARADVVIDIVAGAENAVSTKTYTNTLAAGMTVANAFAGRDVDQTLEHTALALRSYLERWEEHLGEIGNLLAAPQRLYVVGRGRSLAAVGYSALILKEAAKIPVEGLSAPQFRHGPLELADERLDVVVFAGDNPTDRERNKRLLTDLRLFGARAFWVDDRGDDMAGPIPMPETAGADRAICEIVPMQLLAVAISQHAGIEPGKFRYLEKVTTIA